jgi:hypothetical protein
MLKKDRQRCSRIAQRLNVREKVRLASSFAAASLDGLFEHPDAIPVDACCDFHG